MYMYARPGLRAMNVSFEAHEICTSACTKSLQGTTRVGQALSI